MFVKVFFFFFLHKDNEDEMSSDSLSLAPHEDNSSSEEAQMQECLTRTKSTEKEDRAAASRLEGFFVLAEADTETDLHTDKQEQQTEPLLVTHFHISIFFLKIILRSYHGSQLS